jgi:hypothetical protein
VATTQEQDLIEETKQKLVETIDATKHVLNTLATFPIADWQIGRNAPMNAKEFINKILNDIVDVTAKLRRYGTEHLEASSTLRTRIKDTEEERRQLQEERSECQALLKILRITKTGAPDTQTEDDVDIQMLEDRPGHSVQSKDLSEKFIALKTDIESIVKALDIQGNFDKLLNSLLRVPTVAHSLGEAFG